MRNPSAYAIWKLLFYRGFELRTKNGNGPLYCRTGNGIVILLLRWKSEITGDTSRKCELNVENKKWHLKHILVGTVMVSNAQNDIISPCHYSTNSSLNIKLP